MLKGFGAVIQILSIYEYTTERRGEDTSLLRVLHSFIELFIFHQV